jgi:hypothetical protein
MVLYPVNGRWVRVVGVAANSKYENMREIPRPFFYVPLRQNFAKSPDLNIRTTQPLRTVAAALGREVHTLDPNLALYEMITLQEQVDRSTSPQLVAVTLVAILGGLALLLAAIGIYGVMSYTVSQSTRELGLRMALGAGASNLLRVVIARGFGLNRDWYSFRNSSGAGADAVNGRSALPHQPVRSSCLRPGISHNDEHHNHSLPVASLARHTD